jgi:hypothetical protein
MHTGNYTYHALYLAHTVCLWYQYNYQNQQRISDQAVFRLLEKAVFSVLTLREPLEGKGKDLPRTGHEGPEG